MPCTHAKCTKDNAKEIRPKVLWWRCPDCGLEVERDERTLDEIDFTQDGDPRVSASRVPVRAILRTAGAEVAQDILDLGCTGLASELSGRDLKWLSDARTVRGGMAGAGFGLPCYVPPTRFCLVHNCIGALEPGQEAKHPEGVELCSRELTVEEAKMAAAMDILTQGKPQGEEVAPSPINMPVMAAPGSPIALYDGFVCPEHREPVWRCRYCLAAAVISGGYEPSTVLRLAEEKADRFVPGSKLDEALAASDEIQEIELYVAAAIWRRKMVLDRG